ncbi:mitochondrial dicarboxylate/tricarboxylate transporter DTC [Dorcoceras hygrometricum]|uniref:Mitochondrial dicarboxylate/tricarboxylate transporter DTC n=1 Tax=Dorcoceras hygrometricum TaxID=472368 RepID=A0A2Z7AW33_9LAMI|nr:mitochondrial dicarboxylate/tricarboxylate transporter DTC [Dorcoceras hygrometricum]
MGENKPKTAGVWASVKPFANGGISGMLATCVIQPIDMIKVRIQLGQGSGGEVTKNMLKNEGIGAFYKGLSAGLLRQATYTTARLGSFKTDLKVILALPPMTTYRACLARVHREIKRLCGGTSVFFCLGVVTMLPWMNWILTNKALEANDGKPLPLYQKALCGLTAGAIGATVGSPADLALIRMQADATLPVAQRRNYTNAFHALYRITADEGVLALWKGAGPTVVRAMALNMGMLASYDQSVEFFKDSVGLGEAATVLGASSVSGFFAAACSLPFDYVKTQIQKMQPDASGKYPYTGSLDCAMKTLKAGGPFKFYTGFPVYCVRIAPHVMNQRAEGEEEETSKMGENRPKSAGIWPSVKPFANGGVSGMLATCVIQPIDMIKVRIQLGQGSAGEVTKNMLKNDGIGAFYKGLSAGLLRQATYTTARLGSFKMLTNKALEANDGKPLPLYQKALCGLTAGAIGATVGSPADLALIRMQADATLPVAQRRNYTNAFHALYRITADEGVLALWKGAGPTVVRAMALNMGMLASYDQSVEFFKDSVGLGEAATVIGASTVSGFFAAACSLPFDYVKTQIQKMQPDASGKYPYTGSLDCAMKTLKAGGPLKFYTGFPVYCVRIAPHVMMTWIFLNQIQKLQKSAGF